MPSSPPDRVRPDFRSDGRLPLPVWLVVGGLTRLIAYGLVLGAVAALA